MLRIASVFLSPGSDLTLSQSERNVWPEDQIVLGMSLPHRSPDPIDVAVVRQVAQRAEALGFRDLWVTNNTWTTPAVLTRSRS